MHSAPAVVYPVSRSGLVFVLVCAAYMLGAMMLGLWFVQAKPGLPMLLGVFLWFVSGALAWRAWQQSSAEELMWSGQDWRSSSSIASALAHCTEAKQGGNIRVLLDLQQHLLLQLSNESAGHWFWLGERAHPERWQALRRAVAWSVSRDLVHRSADEIAALASDHQPSGSVKAAS